MKLLAASLALAGAEGCTRMPPSNILPYVRQPELTPGIPAFYATSMMHEGFATGLLVESHEGRPTKVEGNPDHPASLGATGVLEQASILQLYDPHRATGVRARRQPATWRRLADALSPASLGSRVGSRGDGLHLLIGPTSSPLEREWLQRVLERYPAASLHVYSPLGPSPAPTLPHYGVADADVIVAVDADFLASGPFHLRHAREFAARRAPESRGGMNRCYAIESTVTVTGNTADHRIAVRPHEIEAVVEALLEAVAGRTPTSAFDPWLRLIADDLRAHRGRSLVVAGPFVSSRAQLLALRINQALGNIGQTLWFTESALAGAGDPRQRIGTLVDAMQSRQVDTLVCCGVNASYATAGAIEFSSLLGRVRQSVYLGLYDDETARECTWGVAAAHFLEAWGDARAYDGTLSLVQPLIQPLNEGKTLVELLSLLVGDADARTYDLLRASWSSRLAGQGPDPERAWAAVLGRGFLEGSAFPRVAPPADVLDDSPIPGLAPVATEAPAVDVIFRPHPRIGDGSFADNGWLQELPDPITTLTWDNAAHMSPATAQRLGVENGTLVALSVDSRQIELPAIVVAHHADDCVTVHFGYGREGTESLARGVGTNVYPLWPGDRFTLAGVALSRVEGAPRHALAITQPHRELGTSNPVRVMHLDDYERQAPPKTIYPLTLYEPSASLPDGVAPQQWAMTIDLGACLGCGACMVACQAENNVPVVGREQVLVGREMHWLRIDWYTPPERGDGAAIPQPMLCQQCEKAPCEYVCPVEATVHSRDGLNEMVYNRCVGTRFCSNNCPYKVRRFNWFDFNAHTTDTERMARNPDVTVRERGVMEKCTFCVQRIRQAEIAARTDGRPMRPSEVHTACEQACPTRAITFGSLTDPDSPMVHARATRRAYTVLEELGTRPRITYLARVRNPHPDLERHA
jgi:molybdopterin-containing oxidoreductase family iron-sulfur binding subunit